MISAGDESSIFHVRSESNSDVLIDSMNLFNAKYFFCLTYHISHMVWLKRWIAITEVKIFSSMFLKHDSFVRLVSFTFLQSVIKAKNLSCHLAWIPAPMIPIDFTRFNLFPNRVFEPRTDAAAVRISVRTPSSSSRVFNRNESWSNTSIIPEFPKSGFPPPAIFATMTSSPFM